VEQQQAGRRCVLELAGLDALIEALWRRGFTVIGPTVRSQAVVLRELGSAAELPAGWTDEQDGGSYRLTRREDGALFAFNAGPESWKSFLFPPTLKLWSARRREDGGVQLEQPEQPPRYAFLGVRACDLHAIAIQDRIFTGDRFVDRDYEARRRDAFIVAVNCARAGGTCFCVSMGTGPRADSGYDLALTELLEGEHRFLVEVGSERGAEVLAELPQREAAEDDERAADDAVARTAASMGRTLETGGIKELLYGNLEHPRWDEVAARCLTCGNCTLVCPTCFCSTVEDVTDLTGSVAERTRRWDSCFTLGHSYIHGGSLRPSGQARYRQWLTHKLASWIDQFGSSGCVGCGRCITWCPVAIDITEEAAAIRAADRRGHTAPGGNRADH
jgi:sulfhydrogenase subunit beta (sulfur reductase)